MSETWKEIKGFEGKYAVSNLGNVKRAVVAKRLSDHSDIPYKGYRFRYCKERSE